MQIKQCARTGLYVSALGLGTLTWGRDTEAPEACDILTRFVEQGGTLVECSPTHGDGMATDVLAEATARIGRHRLVLAWRGAIRPAGVGQWLPAAGRGDMLRSLDDTLSRLGTDYVDIWLAEPDPRVPLDETLDALTLAYRSGRARYVGLACTSPWLLSEAITRGLLTHSAPISVVELPLSLAETRYVSIVEELRARGVAVFASSPLAGGVLTGKYRHSTPPDSRGATSHLRHLVEPYLDSRSRSVVEAVSRAAQGLDRSSADVSLTWVRDYAGVSSAIVGPRTVRQLDALLEHSDPLPQPIRQVLEEITRR